MALFSFSDIKFTPTDRRFSSNSNLTGNSKYQTNISRYPSDLGDANKGHYMIIHINEQLKTLFRGQKSDDLPTIFTNRARSGVNAIPGQIAGVVSDVAGFIGVGSDLGKEQLSLGFTRTIQRTTNTIALYMPDTLNFTHNQAYSDLSLSNAVTAGVSAGLSIADTFKSTGKIFSSEQLANLSPFLARAVQDGDLGKAIFAAYTGKVINPMLDMIYTSPAFREFRFDFMFYPRSQNEAKEVNSIIRKLKFHQAPELDVTKEGFFLIPPSEFDIKFYCNGAENPNIPKISTCVLTSIDVDYAPNGWSAYEMNGNSGPTDGGTGMPVGIRMGLQFKETEVLVKNTMELSEPTKFGTRFGSEQSNMLLEQERGFN